MCGLVGIAGVLETKHINAFNNALLFNIPRGRDSTGVWSCDRDTGRKVKDMYILKAPVHALDLQEFKSYDRVVNSVKHCIIGHGRSATVGRISRGNAHPFDFDNIAGAHNGTISSYNMNKLEDHDKFGTDSEAIFHNINRYGVETTIEALTGGAWALTWYDKTDHSINLLRNDQRPLFFAVINDGKTLIWGSEPGVLHAACERNNIETDELMEELPVNVWYKWRLPDARDTVLPKPVVKEVKQKEVAVVNYSANNFRSGPVGVGSQLAGRPSVGDARQKYAALTEAKVIDINQHKRGKIVNTRTVIEGWNKKRLTETEFRNRTGEVCAYSDDVVTFDDVVTGKVHIVFINETQFVKRDFNDAQNHMWLGRDLVDLAGLK